MSVATLTTKGQITLPKKIRESLDLSTGDKIEFFIKKDSEVVLRPVVKKVDEVFGMLKKPKQKAVSVNEMNRVLSKRFQKKFKTK